MDTKYLTCIICCEDFKSGCSGGDLGNEEENLQSLSKFCEVILDLDKSILEGKDGLTCFYSNYKRETKIGRAGKKRRMSENILDEEVEQDYVDHNNMLSKFLKDPDDSMSICGNCLDLMNTVTEFRLSAKCVEESVEKLQMLLLRELRRLQGRLDMFWAEFQKLEKTLVEVDSKCVETKLDDSYSHRIGGGKGMGRKTGKHRLERKREILGFRGKISQVFNDFHQFQSTFVDKLSCNAVGQAANVVYPSSSKKLTDAQVQADIQPKTDKQLRHGHSHDDKLVSATASHIFGGIGSNQYDTIEDMDDEPVHLDNFDDNDNLSSGNQVDSTGNQRTSLRSRDKKKYNLTSSESEVDEDPHGSGNDDTDDYNPEAKKNMKQAKTKLNHTRPRRRARNKTKKHNEPKFSDEDEDEQKLAGDDDGDEEYNPNPDETDSCRAQIIRVLLEYEPHLASMSPFKRNFVRRVLYYQVLCEDLQNKKGPENISVYTRYMTQLSFNVETKLVSLGGIPIKILCEKEKEKLPNDRVEDEDSTEINLGNGLLCTKCDLFVPKGHSMRLKMFNHVLAKHLNAYQCPYCKDKTVETHTYYKAHVLKCQGGEVVRIVCDICGKNFCNKSALQGHKWRKHMNEEEKKYALETGQVKAHMVIPKKGLEKKFQCEQCGKGFPFKAQLKKHESTHQERDSRETIICPKCGKSFLKTGYQYHLKYGATCGENDTGRMETCEKCGKTFRNKVLLRRHVREIHIKGDHLGDAKPFVCGICGKAFKYRLGLMAHEKTHSGEKPCVCTKCGSAFTKPFSLKRHEKTCEYRNMQ